MSEFYKFGTVGNVRSDKRYVVQTMDVWFHF